MFGSSTARQRVCRSLIGLGALLLTTAGCGDVFSTSFLDSFTNASPFTSVSQPSGHIPMLFNNNARFSDDLFRYLLQNDSVVTTEVLAEMSRVNPQLTEEEMTSILEDVINGNVVDLEGVMLPPRIRVTVDVTKSGGGVQRLEFIDGLRLVRGEDQLGNIEGDLPPALTENTNNTFVVQCDVDVIQIVQIDVFVPVVVRQLEREDVEIGTEQIEECVGFEQPSFETLQEDLGFDTIVGVFTVIQNYDPRNFPPPLINLQCGGVVVIEVEGDATVPFTEVPNDCLPDQNPPDDGRTPGYFIDDFFGFQQSLQIPGRYSVSLQVTE